MSPVREAPELVARAKATIENLDPAGLEQEMSAGALVVDLREPDEIDANGGIPGTVHVPRGMLEFRASPSTPYHQEGFEPGRRVILHCASGGRSALAAVTLREMGYQNVAHLDGGFTAWVESGRPVSRP